MRRETETTVCDIKSAACMLAEPLETKQYVQDSPTSGSPSSSSEESRIEHVARNVESVKISLSRGPSLERPGQLPEPERGRNQALSPLQGHSTSDDYASILRLPPGEVILFNSSVEARYLRRRASRLLPLPVPPSKPKTRELVLTSRRLICLKQRQKGLGDISVKSELALRASEKLKEKDKEKESRGIVASVERKGEREFVVLTSSKTYSYAAADLNLANTWTEHINTALASNGRQPSKGRS